VPGQLGTPSEIPAAARVGCSRCGAIRAPEEWPSRRATSRQNPAYRPAGILALKHARRRRCVGNVSRETSRSWLIIFTRRTNLAKSRPASLAPTSPDIGATSMFIRPTRGQRAVTSRLRRTASTPAGGSGRPPAPPPLVLPKGHGREDRGAGVAPGRSRPAGRPQAPFPGRLLARPPSAGYRQQDDAADQDEVRGNERHGGENKAEHGCDFPTCGHGGARW
jgi:hypothetical protein